MAVVDFPSPISLTEWRERWSRPLLDFFVFATREQIVTERFTISHYNQGRVIGLHPAIRRAAADRVWVGDITYLKVGGIYRYLAVVMDKYSRRVVGWSYGPRKDVKLTLQALERAVRARRPASAIVFHTDRGIEYAAGAFKQRIAELGFTQSMNRPGKVTDNAFIESFFHSMKSEVFHGYRFNDDKEVRAVLKNYLPFYNRDRLHSSLDYVSPATFERQVQ